MQIKKRKYIPTAKTDAMVQEMETAQEGPIHPKMISAKTGKSESMGITAKMAPYEMSAVAKLRSAKKLKDEPEEVHNEEEEREEAQAPRKMRGEVELGPTETSQKTGYYERLKKRSK